MFGNIGKIMGIITEKGAVKKLIGENAGPLMKQLIGLLNQKFETSPAENEQPAVMFFPDQQSNATAVLLVYLDENGTPDMKGHCSLDEIIGLLPDDIMSLMK